MKKAKLIAISAVAAALSTILLTIGAYFPPFDLSAIFTASLATMLPLAKKTKTGAFLTVIAASLLTLFLSGFRFQIVIPYATFFGLHPILNYIEEEKRLNKVAVFIIKDVWFVITLVIMQKLLEVVAVDVSALSPKLIMIIIVTVGALAFIVYDMMFKSFQRAIVQIIKRLKI